VAISRRLLDQGEEVLVSTRTHVKALLSPSFVLILVAGVAGFLSTLPSGDPRLFLTWVIWLVALAAILWFVVRPFLGWLSTTYTVTDRRLITRSGIVTRRGRDIPLARITDVAYEHGLLDRVLGCGTLVISDASGHGRVELHDIPQVEQVHRRISDQLFDVGGSSSDDRYLHHADDGT